MSTYFTADSHFFHKNIIKHSNRPFEDVEEMHEYLIQRWNARVKQSDIIWHLGDVSFGTEEQTGHILKRLNGRKNLILGNHDDTRWNWAKYFETVNYYHVLRDNKQKIILMHFPIESWDSAHRGSWHLHGHSHGNLDNGTNTRIDIGVDCFNYAPVSIDEIRVMMKDRTFKSVDHHTNNPALKEPRPKPEMTYAEMKSRELTLTDSGKLMCDRHWIEDPCHVCYE